MNIIFKAPGALILILIIAVIFACFVAHWRYSKIIDEYDSALQAQGERHRAELLK